METRRGKKGSKQTWWSTCQYSYIVHVYNIHTFTLFYHYRIFSVQYCYIFSFLYIYSKYSSLRGGEASFHFLCACTPPCRSSLCFIICLLFCSWEMKIFDFSLSSINILVSGQNYVKYGQNLDCHSCFATHLQLLYLNFGISTLARFPFSQQSKSLLIISCFLRFYYSNFE